MNRNSLVMHLYTDDDFSFKNHLSKDCKKELAADPNFEMGRFEVRDYKLHRLDNEEGLRYCFAFTFRDDETEEVIAFLNQLIKDVRYSTHDWINRELRRMIGPAISFLESGKRGLFRTSMVEGNWQPSSLIIVREICALAYVEPIYGERIYETLDGLFELKEPVIEED